MNEKKFKNSVSADWVQFKITHRPLKFLHYDRFKVMLPEQTIFPQAVEEETLHQIISLLFDEYL